MVVEIEREGRDLQPAGGWHPSHTVGTSAGKRVFQNSPRGVTGVRAPELERLEAGLGCGRPWYQPGFKAFKGVATGRAADSSGT
jgi:hypothetical protein